MTRYTGSIFDRLDGLDKLFDICEGYSILDIGSSDGLISYEFARRGALLIHGFEKVAGHVSFACKLFETVPIKAKFETINICKVDSLDGYPYVLSHYDVVLYLGVYHHLLNQSDKESVQGFLRYLIGKAKTFFVVRTSLIGQFEDIILSGGFAIFHESEPNLVVGPLKIYKRI